MRLTISNTRAVFTGGTKDTFKLMDAATAYKVAGCRFSPAYKDKRWDGREHLVRLTQKGITMPVGLAADCYQLLTARGYSVDVADERPEMGPDVRYSWQADDIVPRPYQEVVRASAMKPRGPMGIFTGKGLLNLPTRSGKTVMAAMIIASIRKRALFICNQEMQATQTAELFQRIFQQPIGIVGGGRWEPMNLTVAMVQTLTRRPKGAKSLTPDAIELLSSYDVIFMDECHHLESDLWRQAMLLCNARYKFGLSATIFLDDVEGVERGAIWLKAATGPVLQAVTVSDLIEQGWLVKPEVRVYTVSTPDLDGRGWSDELYREAVTDNERFNRAVVSLARRSMEEGSRVLLVTRRIEHTATLAGLLLERGLDFACITGDTPPEERSQHKKRFERGQIRCLLGTVFGEAVDLPSCDVVINAEGGKSKIATYQRFRNLTPSKGKESAIFIDFMWVNNGILAKHSTARLQAYRSERAFHVISMGDIP